MDDRKKHTMLALNGLSKVAMTTIESVHLSFAAQGHQKILDIDL